MTTEAIDMNLGLPAGWIFFDAECQFCMANRRRWGRIFERRGFVWLPLQTPGAAERLGISPDQLMTEMWVLPTGASPWNGVNAWTGLMRRVWWLKPLAIAIDLPGVKRLAQVVYRWVARNRYCLAGQCRLPPPLPPPATPPPGKKSRHAAFFELP